MCQREKFVGISYISFQQPSRTRTLEVMQNGVPSIGIPQYQHQAETLSRLSTRGAMCSLLPGTELESKLVESITELVFDVRKRKHLSEQALDISDGRGLERVCSVISSLVDSKKFK